MTPTATHRLLRLVPPIADTTDLAAYENPDVVDLADLCVIVGPEPGGVVGAVFDGSDLYTMTPAAARALAAAITRAANDVEALVATG